MKGVINKGIQELVEAKFGAETWARVKEEAGCFDPFFATGTDYPDQVTLDLAAAASKVTGLALAELLVEFGKAWVTGTARRSYPTFFKLAGRTPRQFLLNMNRVHDQVTRSIPNAAPPRFAYEELEDGRLLMHYHSDRDLCAVLHGLILGVGLLFETALGVRETSCKSDGHPHCTFEVTFP